MGMQLNREKYKQLIEDDIFALVQYMPTHSLERNHIVSVLKWSIDQIYGGDGENSIKSGSNCNIPPVISPVCSICGGNGSYSFGGSFGGAVSTIKCNCGANGL